MATQTLPANNGKVTTWSIPDASVTGGDYTWRVRTADQDNATSPWSQSCTFSVDRNRPSKPPVISSTRFPDGRNGWPATTGKARTVELTVACPVEDPTPGCDYGDDWNGDDHRYNAGQIIAPGDLNGDNVPDLWLRDDANGDVFRSYGKGPRRLRGPHHLGRHRRPCEDRQRSHRCRIPDRGLGVRPHG
ncbi:hypothetical protein [Streptomyces sp. NPDC020817]|uniref:hypothetical protein n=1 Tax=Streptomyces sp. NPDC020817 TaxID=3365095 RepID=UPI0037BC66BF